MSIVPVGLVPLKAALAGRVKCLRLLLVVFELATIVGLSIICPFRSPKISHRCFRVSHSGGWRVRETAILDGHYALVEQ